MAKTFFVLTGLTLTLGALVLTAEVRTPVAAHASKGTPKGTASSKKRPTPPALKCNGEYRPGQSGISAEAYWKVSEREPNQPEQQRREKLNQMADPELTPALLHLLTAEDTHIYYGGYSAYEDSKDGRTGLNMILVKRMPLPNGKLVPVAAQVSLEFDPHTLDIHVVPGPDAIRVHSAVHARSPDNYVLNFVGLSYSMEAPAVYQPVEFSPGKHIKHRNRYDSYPRVPGSTHSCLGCHGGENGMNHHTFPPLIPLTTPKQYENYLTSHEGVKEFLQRVERVAYFDRDFSREATAAFVENAREQLKDPRSLIPRDWVEAVRKHCQELQKQSESSQKPSGSGW